jgi:hypothetical protein
LGRCHKSGVPLYAEQNIHFYCTRASVACLQRFVAMRRVSLVTPDSNVQYGQNPPEVRDGRGVVGWGSKRISGEVTTYGRMNIAKSAAATMGTVCRRLLRHA